MSTIEIAPVESMSDPKVYMSTAKQRPPLTLEELANMEKPKVLIVGAGIGGLTLGLLLKKGGVPFEIYERAKEVRPLGSAMLLGSNVTTLLQQLGIYEEFQAIDGVMIRCSDNATHHGDILVGSDGAHSAVRQHLFHVQRKKKLLPKSDDVPLPFSTVCLVGQTVPLDPEDYPLLKTPQSVFNAMLGQGSPYSWSVFTTVKNTFCFNVVLHLDDKTAKANDSSRNSEWGPEAAESMCKD
ncbi:hypothetical protein BGZ93_007721, partial [Podila epicladia]